MKPETGFLQNTEFTEERGKSMKNRIVHFDYLRVFATFAMIIIHIAAQNWYSTAVNTFEWQVFNFYDSIVRWAVPVFVMISGSLFLGKSYEIKKIYSKYIFRMVTAFIFWGTVYAIYSGGDPYTVLGNIFKGYYHMWFIPMIIGLYICIPILHKIAESEKITKYFLVIAFVFAFLLPQTALLVNDFGGKISMEIIYIVKRALTDMDFHLALGYTGYFIGGFYLNKLELNKGSRYIIYLAGILGAIATIVLDSYLSLKTWKPVETYYGNFNINVLLESVAIFVWVKYDVPKPKKLNAIMSRLAQYSFEAYLIHVLAIELLNSGLGLNTLSFHPLLSVPIIGMIVFILSFFLSAIINQIPFLNRHVV